MCSLALNVPKRSTSPAITTRVPQGVLRDPTAPQDAAQNEEAYSLYTDIRGGGRQRGDQGSSATRASASARHVYHGTSRRAAQGVSHLYGSSLPVGGPSTPTPCSPRTPGC